MNDWRLRQSGFGCGGEGELGSGCARRPPVTHDVSKLDRAEGGDCTTHLRGVAGVLLVVTLTVFAIDDEGGRFWLIREGYDSLEHNDAVGLDPLR